MKIIKPMTLGLLHKPHRHNGEERLVVATLGFFRLGEPCTRRYLTENLQWPEALKALPEALPLDEVMPKGEPEWLAAATAYAPGGEPVSEMEAAVRVAGVEKRLRVIGERQWLYGTVPLYRVTPPLAFTKMPLEWSRAYGGERHPRNPEGRAHVGHRFSALVGENHGEMPNIEYPGEPVHSHAKAYTPAGFAPIDPRWQPRGALLGTFDRHWVKELYPALPDDIDWRAYNRSPEDQRFAAPLTGGEPYRIEGLHPEQPVIEGALPRLRPRAFIRFEGEAIDRCREVPLAMDTLWFFPDRELGLVVHRGVVPIADSDALDVAGLMVAYEHLDDTPRPLEYYRRVQAQRSHPESAPAHAINDAPLLPEPDAAQRAQRAAEQRAANEAELARQQANIDLREEEFWADGRLEKPADYTPPKAELPPLGVIPKEAIARGEVDLSSRLAKADELAKAAAEAGRAALKRAQTRVVETPPPPVDPERLANALAAAEARAAHAPLDLLRATASEPTAKQAEPSDPLPALARRGRRAALEVSVDLPAPELADPVGRHLGHCVRRWLAAGAPLAGRDLAGARLDGIDLSGADLREVQLEGADLSGADLRGADLRGAVLTGTRLVATDFEGADLREANLSRCDGERARFVATRLDQSTAVGARLIDADFSDASLEQWSARDTDLSGARFERALLTQATLVKVSAAESSWRDARALMATFMQTLLEGADLSGITLERCAFPELRADFSRWSGARLERCFFGPKSELRGCDLSAVHATICNWRSAHMAGADLSDGAFTKCDFGLADLSGARLRDTLIHRSILMQSRLDACDAEQLDLFHSVVRKASLRGACLDRANLIRADLSGADFEGASLRRARLPHKLAKPGKAA